MKSNRRLMSIILAGCIGLTASSGPVSADSPVPVSVAPFPVQLNGIAIDNKNAEYPLLLYKNITYIPMTWEYCQALALDVNWSQEGGLSISKTAPKAIAVNPAVSPLQEKPDRAVIPTFPITVNGKSVDNSNEPYPLLLYKDVTYFPLTWAFAHDEFQWDTALDSAGGLKIGTDQLQVLESIVYDDETSLYVQTSDSGMLKISKDLRGDPSALTGAEAESIQQSAIEASGAASHPVEVKKEQVADRDGTMIRYKGIDLLDLKAVKSDTILASSVTSIGHDMELVVLVIDNPNGVPEKWWTFIPQYYLFAVKDGAASRVPGIDQSPTRYIASKDGSVWIVSDSNLGSEPRASRVRSQVALIQANGGAYSLNRQLDSADVEIAAIQTDSLIVRSFNNRFSPTMVKEADGFYSVTTGHAIKQLADRHAVSAYKDRNGDVYIVEKNNTVYLANSDKKGAWRDYALKRLQ